MWCKTCDYQLWNIKARRCPECGTPFAVSDYEFVPNSVKFCCPHCGQDYYGTGPRGHLDPPAFDCVSCSQPVTMDEMVLLPAEGLDAEQTRVFRTPWLQRKTNGWFGSWWSTVKMALFSPTKLMHGLAPAPQPGEAIRFAVATYLFMMAVGAAIFTIIGLLGGMFAGSTPGDAMLLPMLVMGLYAAGLLIAVLITASLAHLVLRITGGTAHGFGRTIEAACYAAGVSVLILTGCGTHLFWPWWLISATLMLRQGQRVHGARAALSLLALPILLIVAIMLLVVAQQPMGVSLAPAPTAPPPPAPPAAPVPAPAPGAVTF